MKLKQQCMPRPPVTLHFDLQLVWNSSADKETKARTCAELLSYMTYAAFNMCGVEVKAPGLPLL